MPRINRIDIGNMAYHVINRANARLQIFDSAKDYQAFEQVLAEAQERIKMRILAYCVMSNHWHLVLYPMRDRDLSRFMEWLTKTHTQRWHAAHNTTGSGHLYQGRYKSYPVQTAEYLKQVCRYVEQNPLKAGMVEQAQNWRWSSLWRREYGNEQQKKLLTPWPVENDRTAYLIWVNTLQQKIQVESIETCITRSRPLGSEVWTHKLTSRFDIESTLRPRGRPSGKGS